MAKSVLELAVGTGQWDAGLKKAKSALDNFTQSQGGLQQALAKDSENMRKFVGMMGQMDSSAKTAKGQMNDYKAAIEQLTMQYNRMTDAQKQTIGQDYLQSIDQLKQKYQAVNEEIQEMNRSLNNVKAPDIADGVKSGGLFGGGKLDGMLQVFGGNLMTKGVELATSAVTSLISETGDMIRQGVELAKQGEGIRIAFERLGRGDILQGLREATHGTVTDLELMKAAVKFNDFKLPLEELGTMLAFAQQKAKDTGQSVDYMVDSIVTGLGRKSLMILDNLGLSATEIRERMKETGDMTKAVGAIIRDQMAAAGDYVETAADRAAQANVNLQNKMEELGRKFAPVEEASNHLWTSMKIGILDIIGGPLARLLNDLTEAGRLQNALHDINGDGSNGAETRSGKALRLLREYSGGGRGIEGKRELYNRQVASFQNQEEKEWKKANRLRDELAGLRKKQREDGAAGNLSPLIQETSRQLEEAVNRAKAFQIARNEYEKGAKDIMKPVETNIKTDKSEQNVKKLRQQLKELEEQRKKAVEAGDQEQVDNLTKQISQTKTNLGYLDPSATKGAKAVQDDFTEIIGLIGNAQERVSDLQRQIRESWDQNEITTLNQKLKDAQNELDVLMGKLPKDTTANLKVSIDSDTLHTIEELEDVTFDDKTMTVTANTSEALQKVRELVADAGGEVIEIKVEPVITDEDIERSLREQYGKPIEVPITPMTAADKLELEVRTKMSDQNIEADMQTLRTLMETQIKNGIDGIEIPTGFLIEKIMGEGVPDEYWQNLQDQINEKLKEMDIDPINIDFKTGKEEGKKSKGGPMDDTKKVVSGLNQVASGLQQMGIQLPEGVNQVLGVVNGLMTIIQAISTIIGVTQTAAVTANTIAITALTSAVWANTASSFIPFANGGIVGFANGGLIGKAASGMLIGNHMSGDNLRLPVNGGGMIGVNDGELILNRSQQGVIANALEGGNALQNLQLNAVIRGEQIRLALNNNGRRTGRGEYVQTNRR